MLKDILKKSVQLLRESVEMEYGTVDREIYEQLEPILVAKLEDLILGKNRQIEKIKVFNELGD